MGEENIWGGKTFGVRKTFGVGKIQFDEIIWDSKKFGGAKHLGEERFN